MGIYEDKLFQAFGAPVSRVLIVTNIAVYESQLSGSLETSSPFQPIALTLIHTWGGGEINAAIVSPGECCSFITVNETVYIAGIFLNGIFSWGAALFLQATAYVSTKYLIESNGRLVAGECRFPGGGGPSGNVITATIAWSAVGAFTQWDPAVNAQAGFNLLSDVPDQITGLASIGRSALIFRNEGNSQMDPNAGSSNSGLQPFIFYHLWASNQGVGAFQNTVAQYGGTCYFRADDNVYSISISSGLSSVGDKIIPKIANDYKFVGSILTQNASTQPTFYAWYFSSIVHIDGELHYLLSFTSNLVSQVPGFVQCVVYDFNIRDGSWHLWNLNNYLSISGNPPAVVGFSCPIVQTRDSGQIILANGAPQDLACVIFENILFGGYTTYGTSTVFSPAGVLNQLIPCSYDSATSFITAYNSPVYPPLYVPQTTLTFRGEIISPGRKQTGRRLRIQADNCPMPTIQTGAVQQATVTFTGPSVDPQSNVRGVSSSQVTQYGSTLAGMQGNSVSTLTPLQGMSSPGLLIQTYYSDPVLSDEMLQASITSPVVDSANPWKSLALFRISNVELVAADTKATQQ